jgi:ComF family protein
MPPIACRVCDLCGEGILSEHAFHANKQHALCGLCSRVAPPYAKATAYGSYEGGLRELIHLLKYDDVRPAANVLGRMLAETIASLLPSMLVEGALFQPELLVVPVPLHARKLKQRRFNQSEWIARAALKLKPGSHEFAFAPECLVRQRETKTQIGLTRHQRRENMRGAFAVTNPAMVRERDVLLIDDVFTTGTTVSECARVLRRAGAKRVFVATVARTLKFEAQGVLKPGQETDSRRALAVHA